MIVMLHGFGGTHRHFDRVRAERYLAPDIRGHGDASGVRPITVEACIQDVAALAPTEFDLCGYSMGGRLALHVALAMRERVRRLVLLSTSAGIEDPAERAARRNADEELAARIEAGGIEAHVAAWSSLGLFAADPPDVSAAAARDALRCEPAGLAAALRGLGSGVLEPLWGRLGELEMPVEVLVGERDRRYVELGARLARALPRGELRVVAGSGHRLALEAPAAVAAVVR
ncbi:MAG: alpha/beta fold hydrolase [Solirubrobacteraceae bacterium]